MFPISLASGALLTCSSLYHLATLVSALRWKRDNSTSRTEPADAPFSWPGVTILKPLRGIDPGHAENLRSFCELDYPDYQVVFGALDPEDPGLADAVRLQGALPDHDIVVVRGGSVRGANRKVSTLLEMMPHARHEILVVADSDMRVEPDYLRQVVREFAEPSVGLVTCPYRGKDPARLAGILEALAIGAEFIPSAFLAYYGFSERFAFGSTIAIRREVLEEIGGFEGIAHLLADDFALADRTRKAGNAVRLSGYVVDDMLGAEPWTSVWRRRLRWARTSRALRPGPYWGLFVTYLTPLALFHVILSGFSTPAWILALSALLLRMAVALGIALGCTRDREVARWIWLLPFGEMLSEAIWLASLADRRIHWRGELYIVTRDGRMEPVKRRA